MNHEDLQFNNKMLKKRCLVHCPDQLESLSTEKREREEQPEGKSKIFIF
jgi:hypothetical protein